MGLRKDDLKDLVDHIFEIDSFKSKMGSDSDIVVLSFSTKNEASAKDLENFLEKATEIGVSEISPIICERTVKKNLNFDRCIRILISGMKQSYKFKLPQLNKMQDFNSFMKARDEKVKLLATCEEVKKNKLFESFSKNQKNLIIIMK